MSDSVKFKSYWKSQYGDALPVGKIAKKEHQKRSFRIHNLPDSRKQPENSEELDEIKYRHNWVNNYVLSTNTPCYIACTTEGEKDLSHYSNLKWLTELEIMETQEYTFHDGDDYQVMTSYIAEITWNENAWDELIVDVAENKAPHVLIVSQSNGRVYAPYFGGADLFMESDMMAEGMASQFSEWLSPYDPRKDG